MPYETLNQHNHPRHWLYVLLHRTHHVHRCCRKQRSGRGTVGSPPSGLSRSVRLPGRCVPGMVARVTIAAYNRQIRIWRDDAKARHGYTQKELAKKIGCSESVLSHKSTLYSMPFYQVMRLKELANGEDKRRRM